MLFCREAIYCSLTLLHFAISNCRPSPSLLQPGLPVRVELQNCSSFCCFAKSPLTDSSSDRGLSSTEQAWCQTLPDISWPSRLLAQPCLVHYFSPGAGASLRTSEPLWAFPGEDYLVPYSYLYSCIFSFSEKLPAALFWLHVRLTLSKF